MKNVCVSCNQVSLQKNEKFQFWWYHGALYKQKKEKNKDNIGKKKVEKIKEKKKKIQSDTESGKKIGV